MEHAGAPLTPEGSPAREAAMETQHPIARRGNPRDKSLIDGHLASCGHGPAKRRDKLLGNDTAAANDGAVVDGDPGDSGITDGDSAPLTPPRSLGPSPAPMPDPATAMPRLERQHPKQLGPYTVGPKLGEGAFAVVRRGTHAGTMEPVALKLIDKSALDEEYLRTHVSREQDLLSRLEHPNVVRLLEVIENEQYLCLVLELYPIDTLSFLCKNGLVREAEARIYARQLLAALEYLHAKDVVHRDLKMENLMLDHDGRIRVIDFGLSGDMRGKDYLDTQCGSMAYSAPELLCHKPYGKQSLTELHALALEGSFSLPDTMSAAGQDFFRRIFNFKPKKRITVAELWEHDWITAASTPPRAPPGTNYAPTLADLDMDLVSKAAALLGTPESAIIKAMLENHRDRNSATYYLLVASTAAAFRAKAALEAEQARKQQFEGRELKFRRALTAPVGKGRGNLLMRRKSAEEPSRLSRRSSNTGEVRQHSLSAVPRNPRPRRNSISGLRDCFDRGGGKPRRAFSDGVDQQTARPTSPTFEPSGGKPGLINRRRPGSFEYTELRPRTGTGGDRRSLSSARGTTRSGRARSASFGISLGRPLAGSGSHQHNAALLQHRHGRRPRLNSSGDAPTNLPQLTGSAAAKTANRVGWTPPQDTTVAI